MSDTIQKTLADREGTHGGFRHNSHLSQELKSVTRAHEGWDHLEFFEKEALEMIIHKVSRILAHARRSGDYKLRQDSWHDVAGYALLVENEGEPPNGQA